MKSGYQPLQHFCSSSFNSWFVQFVNVWTAYWIEIYGVVELIISEFLLYLTVYKLKTCIIITWNIKNSLIPGPEYTQKPNLRLPLDNHKENWSISAIFRVKKDQVIRKFEEIQSLWKFDGKWVTDRELIGRLEPTCGGHQPMNQTNKPSVKLGWHIGDPTLQRV